MTTDFRALCAELYREFSSLYGDMSARIDFNDSYEKRADDLCDRAARALLDQPELKRPKPVVDYSRIPEIATEAEIRSAAQYLVKAKGCDGDLIPAIEYAIARWGADQRGAINEAELQKARDEELEACCQALYNRFALLSCQSQPVANEMRDWLRSMRRPKPPSLKEQALAELESIMTELHDETGSAFTASAIRRALEALDD